MTPGASRHAVLVPALAVFASHAALLGAWIVDDAGISFAYARSLAGGHGLVAQPGAAPVEGFSNPLWTLLLSGPIALGVFDPVWTPKLLAFGLVTGAFALLVAAAPAPGRGSRTAQLCAASAPLLAALSPSFVIWCASGLENPLYALLAALLLVQARRLALEPGPGLATALGATCAALALTRPEGFLFAALAPVALGLGLAAVAPEARRMRARLGTAALLVGFAVPFGGYLLFRRLYFADWLPNAYYAKVQPWLIDMRPGRLAELVSSAAGVATPLALLLAAAGGLLALRRVGRRALLLPLATGLAAAAYLLLPPDWMGEHRFATAFVLLFAALVAEGAGECVAALARRPASPRLVALPALALTLVIAGVAREAGARTPSFAKSPIVPFARIEEFGAGYEQLAGLVPGRPPSLLAPDLGGTLWRARSLRVHDLAGMCDRTVARTLMSDTRAFHDYVFGVLRPTFIHVHGSWSDWAALHSDARFARDYVSLHEDWRRPPDRAPAADAPVEPWAADYVRREALRSDAHLAELRAAFSRLGLDRPLP